MLPPDWFTDVTESLQTRLLEGTLPHAICLTSAPGWGLEHLAIEVAKLLLQSDKQLNADNVREFAHPDFRWTEPDGAEIKVDQIRQINQFSVQTSQMAARKVAVVWEAEKLNENAANALLKTLEEPPADTHIILVSENWGRVLPTIRSRCQRWSLTQDETLGRRWLEANGVNVDEMTFAIAGASPMPIYDYWSRNQSAGFDVTGWLQDAQRNTNSASLSKIDQLDPIYVLNIWYRRIKLHLSSEFIPGLDVSARQLHGFTDQLLSVRRQIETKNSARVSANLMIEGLLVEWRKIAG
ncbi:MAG: hypothetical protein AAF541_19045 [Pseudomonadota bacterium]